MLRAFDAPSRGVPQRLVHPLPSVPAFGVVVLVQSHHAQLAVHACVPQRRSGSARTSFEQWQRDERAAARSATFRRRRVADVARGRDLASLVVESDRRPRPGRHRARERDRDAEWCGRERLDDAFSARATSSKIVSALD